MKYILIIILMGCCTYIGYGFSKYYTNRKVFFNDLVLLMDKLKLDINFSKDKVGDIVKDYVCFSSHFEKLKNNFLTILQSNQFEDGKLFDGINILKQEEINSLKAFFKSLGRFDVENQTKQIISFKEEFKKYENESNLKKQKYGSLFIKLGFIVGVLISLLII